MGASTSKATRLQLAMPISFCTTRIRGATLPCRGSRALRRATPRELISLTLTRPPLCLIAHPPQAPCKATSGGSCEQARVRERSARVSTSMIFAGLNNGRADRKVLPLFSFDGGVVLSPDNNKLSCACVCGCSRTMLTHVRLLARQPSDRVRVVIFACCAMHPTDSRRDTDGADGHIDDGAKVADGCGSKRCDASNPMKGWCRCGFMNCDGQVTPYRAEDLGQLLQTMVEHGPPFTGIGSYTGYNELVIESATWLSHLPAVRVAPYEHRNTQTLFVS